MFFLFNERVRGEEVVVAGLGLKPARRASENESTERRMENFCV